MTTFKCIKEFKSKKGLTFLKDKDYESVINHSYIRIYFNNHSSIVIKRKSLLNKYFV